jgi:hypothetical protein
MFLPSEREGQFRPSWLVDNAGREKWPDCNRLFNTGTPAGKPLSFSRHSCSMQTETK